MPLTHKVFTVKSSHGLQASWIHMMEERIWKSIWKLNVQERVKIFIWELSHSRLLTNEARWKQGLTLSGDCGSYLGIVETCLHIVRDCSKAAEVWLNMLPPSFSQKFFSLSIFEWLEWNLVGHEMSVFHKNWAERMATLCLWIWKWRNERIFRNNSIPIEIKLELF